MAGHTKHKLGKIRQDAHAKARRIDDALAAIDALLSDEAEFVYAKLEQRIVAKHTTRARSAERDDSAIVVAPSVPNKHATRNPSFAALAEQFILEKPQGLRTYEIGKAIGQTSSNVFTTLKLLLRQRRVACHGKGHNRLWTPPDVTPVQRTETIESAVLHVLAEAAEPLDRHTLCERTKTFLLARGRSFHPDSPNTTLGKLVTRGTVVQCGVNEHGALYTLNESGEVPEQQTIN